MDVNINHNFYCATSRGFLASATWKIGESNIIKPQYNTENKGDGISSFEYGRYPNEIVVGTVKGNVRLYDVLNQSYNSKELISSKQPSDIVGSAVLQDNIVFGQKNGIVTNWNPSSNQINTVTIPVGKDADIRRFRRNIYRENLFAVAGHRYEYTLWDLEQKKIVFAAKSLPADQLYQLPQTTFANDHCVLNFGGGHVGAIVTAEGVTMLYDDRAQRRPVFILKKASKGGAQTSFTCIKPAKGLDHLLTAGTTRGALHLLDIRGKNGYMGAITGYNGAVTSLAPMNVGADSAIASTCLDGNLRVHCVTTKKLLYKMYMKVGLTGVLTQSVTLKRPELQDEQIAESGNLDNIFASMETIADEHSNEIIHDSNANQDMVENQDRKKNSKAKREKSKAHLRTEDDEVYIKPLEIKPTELQRLWKDDIAMLISTDPFKKQMEFLLKKEIKIEDEIEEHIENNFHTNHENNESIKNRKLKRKNDEITIESNIDNIKDMQTTKRSKSLDSKIILQEISKAYTVCETKDEKTVETKKSKKKSSKTYTLCETKDENTVEKKKTKKKSSKAYTVCETEDENTVEKKKTKKKSNRIKAAVV